ncbi:MAG: hypothetical protein NVSMB51_17970 [Solirubrobacteraceae bacterium]
MARPAIPDHALRRLQVAAARLGVGAQVRAVWRAFEPPHATQDRRDNEHLRAMLAALLAADANCIDIGAHEGSVLADIVRLAPHGRHVAFEPLPVQHADLVRRFPGVEVRRAALSDHAGEAPFVHPLGLPGWSGLRATAYPGAPQIEVLTVVLERLDDVLPPDFAPDFIKLDANGAELQVLMGARRTLLEHRPAIAFEHGLGAADRYGTRPEQIFDLLVGDAGLRIFDLDGNGPYTPERFTAAFERHEHVNFLARV